MFVSVYLWRDVLCKDKDAAVLTLNSNYIISVFFGLSYLTVCTQSKINCLCRFMLLNSSCPIISQQLCHCIFLSFAPSSEESDQVRAWFCCLQLNESWPPVWPSEQSVFILSPTLWSLSTIPSALSGRVMLCVRQFKSLERPLLKWRWKRKIQTC